MSALEQVATVLPDPKICRTRYLGRRLNLSECLVSCPDDCPYVSQYKQSSFCLHIDRRTFERREAPSDLQLIDQECLLPSEPIQPTTANSRVVPGALRAGQAIRVLAVDDNDMFLSVVKSLLEPLGYEVCCCASSVKALEKFTRDKEKFDLVLLDYFMPHLDGAEMYKWLRKINPSQKIILVTGAEELRLRQILAKHQFNACIHKPFQLQEAMHTIRQVMGEETTGRILEVREDAVVS
jgi:CheY-like chemotaxis protein